MLQASDRLVEAWEALLLLVMAVVFVTGVSGELMADVGFVRVVMALMTVIAWAVVLSVWLMRLSGLSGLMLLSDGIVWAAMLVVLVGVLVVVAWVAVFVFVTGVSDELMA